MNNAERKFRRHRLLSLFRSQDAFNVHIDFGRILLALTVGRVFLFHSLRRGVTSLAHCAGVIFFGFGIQRTLATTFCRMSAVRSLAKVGVILDGFLANVAHERPTGTPNLVATVTLDDGLFTFGTFANHRFRDGFFDLQASLCLYLFSFDFLATATTTKNGPTKVESKRNMTRFRWGEVDVP
jgi:hypothetical protein